MLLGKSSPTSDAATLNRPNTVVAAEGTSLLRCLVAARDMSWRRDIAADVMSSQISRWRFERREHTAEFECAPCGTLLYTRLDPVKKPL